MAAIREGCEMPRGGPVSLARMDWPPPPPEAGAEISAAEAAALAPAPLPPPPEAAPTAVAAEEEEEGEAVMGRGRLPTETRAGVERDGPPVGLGVTPVGIDPPPIAVAGAVFRRGFGIVC